MPRANEKGPAAPHLPRKGRGARLRLTCPGDGCPGRRQEPSRRRRPRQQGGARSTAPTPIPPPASAAEDEAQAGQGGGPSGGDGARRPDRPAGQPLLRTGALNQSALRGAGAREQAASAQEPPPAAGARLSLIHI